jgi:NADH dehydrogenase (ubiquinone) 1 alpha subcomplex subunit 12
VEIKQKNITFECYTMQITRFLRGLKKLPLKEYWKQFYFYRDIRPDGCLVGEDQFGNRYYEEYTSDTIFGRERWVIYADAACEPSQVPPEWHMWLHRISDVAPSRQSPAPYKFKEAHTANLTGTEGEYRPYNTTVPKIFPWRGSNQ